VSAPEGTSSKNKVVQVKDEHGNDVIHPGYFWLAYHWKNLLPACHICNRNGKRDLFPVKNTHVAVRSLSHGEVDQLLFKLRRHTSDETVYYLEPEDLDRLEGRVLLHPYFDKPSNYLTFGIDGGVEGLDAEGIGNKSIETYRLKDEKLRTARNKSQNGVFKDYMVAIAYTDGDITLKKNAGSRALEKYIEDGGPYVSAVIDYLHINLRGSPYDPKNNQI
jgi:hypothetical protein